MCSIFSHAEIHLYFSMHRADCHPPRRSARSHACRAAVAAAEDAATGGWFPAARCAARTCRSPQPEPAEPRAPATAVRRGSHRGEQRRRPLRPAEPRAAAAAGASCALAPPSASPQRKTGETAAESPGLPDEGGGAMSAPAPGGRERLPAAILAPPPGAAAGRWQRRPRRSPQPGGGADAARACASARFLATKRRHERGPGPAAGPAAGAAARPRPRPRTGSRRRTRRGGRAPGCSPKPGRGRGPGRRCRRPELRRPGLRRPGLRRPAPRRRAPPRPSRSSAPPPPAGSRRRAPPPRPPPAARRLRPARPRRVPPLRRQQVGRGRVKDGPGTRGNRGSAACGSGSQLVLRPGPGRVSRGQRSPAGAKPSPALRGRGWQWEREGLREREL